MVVLHFNLFKSKQVFLEKADLFGLWGTYVFLGDVFRAMGAKTARKYDMIHVHLICVVEFSFSGNHFSLFLIYPFDCFHLLSWKNTLHLCLKSCGKCHCACLSLRRCSKINSNLQITECLAALVLSLLEMKSLVSVFSGWLRLSLFCKLFSQSKALAH